MKQLHRPPHQHWHPQIPVNQLPAILRFLLEDGLMIFCLTMFLLACLAGARAGGALHQNWATCRRAVCYSSRATALCEALHA